MSTYADVAVGDVDEFGRYEVTKGEILSFAERYDPQPFHVDEEAAAESMYGGLIASGWHTCAMTMRLLVENSLDEEGSLGSPGVDEIRFRRPVRPGDVLSVRTEVTDKRPLESDPRRGLVKSHVETSNQDDEIVLSMETAMFVRRGE
ncbi:MaoC family dehydratase [Haladaptatus salinisoli]|uniref:MaoC family dehydratase n=1 Tax=Haladaptatus salinisoli TaxID=2884876 RepID=UPI001D0A9AB9|nr:MaoC family dehydratase [Haladaptatus salinisoli]